MSPDEYGQQGYYEPGNFMLVAAGFLAAVMLLLYGTALYNVLHVVTYTEEDVPDVVVEMLDALLVYKQPTEEVTSEYFALRLPYTDEEVNAAKLEAEDEDDLVGEDLANAFILNRPKIALDYLLGEELDKVYGYRVSAVSENYVEVVLLDVANKEMYPRFCIFYQLNDEGTAVTDYDMGRLQPFSRRHEEYSTVWSG